MSGTGHGEVFIRWCAASEIAAWMRHLGESVTEAALHVVMEELGPNDGSGGVIAIDARGKIAMPFNRSGMYRGRVTEAGAFETAIFGA